MNNQFIKAVTARFPREDYLRLQAEAERRGCTIADVIRGAWKAYLELQQTQQLLLKMT